MSIFYYQYFWWFILLRSFFHYNKSKRNGVAYNLMLCNSQQWMHGDHSSILQDVTYGHLPKWSSSVAKITNHVLWRFGWIKIESNANYAAHLSNFPLCVILGTCIIIIWGLSQIDSFLFVHSLDNQMNCNGWFVHLATTECLLRRRDLPNPFDGEAAQQQKKKSLASSNQRERTRPGDDIKILPLSFYRIAFYGF